MGKPTAMATAMALSTQYNEQIKRMNSFFRSKKNSCFFASRAGPSELLLNILVNMFASVTLLLVTPKNQMKKVL